MAYELETYSAFAQWSLNEASASELQNRLCPSEPSISNDLCIAAPVLCRRFAGWPVRLSLVGGELHLAQKKAISVRSQKVNGCPTSQREVSGDDPQLLWHVHKFPRTLLRQLLGILGL